MLPMGRNAAAEARSPKICWSGLSDDTNMNSSGKAKTTARPTRNSQPTTPAPFRRLEARSPDTARDGAMAAVDVSSEMAMSVLLSGHETLHQRYQKHDDEEDERDRRG